MKQRAKILLVDDEVLVLKVTQRTLESAGHEVKVAATGAEGLHLAETYLPDLVLLDRVLPDLDGVDVCRRLKTNPATAQVFVVLLSAIKTSSNDQSEAMEIGADGYIARPINNRELLARVDAFLRLKHTEDALRASEEQLREQYAIVQGMFESTDDMIFAVDQNYRYTSFNQAHAAMMKAIYGADIHIGQRLLDYMSVERDRLAAQRNLDRALQGERFTEESFSDDEHLSRRYFEVAHNPIKNADGHVIGVAVFVKDVTMRKRTESETHCLLDQTEQSRRALLSMLEDRKQIEAELRESEDKFKYMFDHSVIGKSIMLPSGEMMVNQAFCGMLGYALQEFQKKRWQEITHPEDLELTQQMIDLLLSGAQTSARFTKRYMHKNGSVVWADVSTFLRRDPEGQPLYFMTSVSDITERKRAEEEIRWLNEFNESIIQNMQEGIAIADAEGYFIFMNPAAAQILGYPAAELVGQHWNKIIPDNQQVVIRAADERRRQGESDHYEVDVLRKDGVQRSVLISGSPRFDRGRFVGTLSVFTDITERKRAAQALCQLNAELEDRVQERTAQLVAVNQQLQTEIAERQHVETRLLLLHNAVETTDVGVTITDIDGKIVYVNRAEADMHGYAVADLIGQPARLFAPPELAQPITFEHLQPHWERESLNRRRDGATFPVHLVSTPVYNAAGEPTGIITVSEDITERKQVELELQRAKDAADAANRAKSEFLANMSHELRTPLNAILGYAQILPDADNLTERQREILHTIRRSGEHLLQMINDILDLAKIEAGRMELTLSDVRLPELIEDINAIIRVRAQQQGIAFTTEAAAELPIGVRADGKRLQEVLLNLLNNAVKFTQHGSVRLRVYELHEFNELEISETQTPRNSSTHQLRFEVEDTGIGIAPDDLDRLFLPFSQVGALSRSIEGTGLGLAISRKIVELMGGTLQVQSTPGQGSVFWFEIPLHEVSLPAQPLPSGSVHLTGYTGPQRSVLVVDDQAVNRELLQSMLLPLGFHVSEAQNYAECLAQTTHGIPDLILLDLRMPDLDGFEVARRLRRIDTLQHTRIIACSASVFTEILQQSLDAGCDDFLTKPIQRETLLAILQKQLQLEWVATDQPANMTTESITSLALAELLRQLPPEFRRNLLHEAIRGNIKAITKQLDILEKLGEQFFPVVQELRACTKHFKVDRIVELIEHASPEEPL